MPAFKDAVSHTLWGRCLPPVDPMPPDIQGWNSEHPYFTEAIDHYRPGLIVEVGVWKGASVISLASRMKELDLDGCVLAVDTWQGSAEHFMGGDDLPRSEDGRSLLWELFRSNMVHAGVDDYVVPLPLDSQSAATVVRKKELFPAILHLDGSHDYVSVRRDLETWWDLIRPGGTLIADDYDMPRWPDVKRAIDDFFAGKAEVEALPPKCRIVKPL